MVKISKRGNIYDMVFRQKIEVEVGLPDEEIKIYTEEELVRMLLRHEGKDKYNVDHIGYNARLDTLQAAIVLEKFKYVDEFNNEGLTPNFSV